jgi:hypothetical protein
MAEKKMAKRTGSPKKGMKADANMMKMSKMTKAMKDKKGSK